MDENKSLSSFIRMINMLSRAFCRVGIDGEFIVFCGKVGETKFIAK